MVRAKNASQLRSKGLIPASCYSCPAETPLSVHRPVSEGALAVMLRLCDHSYLGLGGSWCTVTPPLQSPAAASTRSFHIQLSAGHEPILRVHLI
jgi:hypothetical protein